MGDYEGYVKWPGGEVYSVQCSEERHDECPQGPDDDETGVPPGGPVFDGYYCECGCGHAVPQSHVRLQDRPGYDELVQQATRKK